MGGNHFHFPSADCRLLLHTIQRNAEQTEGKPLFFFFLEAENCLGNTRGSHAPSWRDVAGDDDWDTAAIAFFDSYDQHELLAVRIPHDKHDMEADPRS